MTQDENEKADAQIRDDVVRELCWEARVDETEVGVSVEKGVVVLQGGVSLMGVAGGYATKLAAEEAAQRVPGVQDVVNILQVITPDGPAQPDTEIA